MSKDPTRGDYQTDFVLRFKAFCPVGEAEKLNTALEGKGFGPNNFSVPCVSAGEADDAEPTHYGTDWQCTADEWAVIQPLLDAHGVKYVRQHDADKKIIESNVAESHAKKGRVMTFDAAAGDCGTKRRRVEIAP